LSLDSKLTKQGPVKILVYNLAGEEIRKILDSSQPAGDIHHSWDGRNKYGAVVGNGVYFILIETPDGNLIQKVIVLK
jgi:flagellar hook assembly protein FlgD